MEKAPHQEYRDDLAKDLKEARSLGEEGKELAESLLDSESQTRAYKLSQEIHDQEVNEFPLKKAAKNTRAAIGELQKNKEEIEKQKWFEDNSNLSLTKIGEQLGQEYFAYVDTKENVAYILSMWDGRIHGFNDNPAREQQMPLGWPVEEKLRKYVSHIKSSGISNVIWVGFDNGLVTRKDVLGVTGSISKFDNYKQNEEIIEKILKLKNR